MNETTRTPSNQATIDRLRFHEFKALDAGFVSLVDIMGDDAAIADAARISYGKGTRSVSDDRTLIRYLMRHRHTTPFEMAEVKLRVKVPMDCWRQWIRHRMASVNEYSTRYSEAIDAMQVTSPGEWRSQSTTNKQGSSGFVTEWPDGVDVASSGSANPGEHLSDAEQLFHELARDTYQERLKFGVAREQARKDLPLSTYTEAIWKIDLHNLMHFLSLRMDSHAQQEIREYATIIGQDIIAPLFPLTWEAFEDYRLKSITLTALDIEAIRRSANGEGMIFDHIENRREQEECITKLRKLGLIS